MVIISIYDRQDLEDAAAIGVVVKGETKIKMLTKKQMLFCDSYAECFNVKTACTESGISEQTGHLLLTKPAIRERINRTNNRAAEKAGLTKKWIIENLMKVAVRSLQSEPVEKYDPIQKGYVETGEYVFDSKGATKSLELLGKHLGMFENTFDFVNDIKTPDGIQSKAEDPVQIIDDVPRTSPETGDDTSVTSEDDKVLSPQPIEHTEEPLSYEPVVTVKYK